MPARPVVWLSDNGAGHADSSSQRWGVFIATYKSIPPRGTTYRNGASGGEKGRRRREDERNEHRGSGASAGRERCDVKESDEKRTCCGE